MRHFRDALRFEAALGIDALDHMSASGHFLHGDVENTALLVKRAARHLRRMGVGGDGGYATYRGHVADVSAVAGFVDRKIVKEWQQNGGDDAFRLVAGHRIGVRKRVGGDPTPLLTDGASLTIQFDWPNRSEVCQA
jgi:hypothetical protein